MASQPENVRERWLTLRVQLEAAPSPRESPALGELYRLAMRDGTRVLARFSALTVQEREDIVSDKFISALDSIVHATNPRGFFITAITRAATSLLRHKQVEQKHQPTLEELDGGAERTEDDTVTTLDLAVRLRQLSARDRQLVRAVHSGESREEVARRLGTSRANVDQVVSRVARMGSEE